MSTASPVRVLHVTETMTGGVVTFVDSISRRQVEAGAQASVLYTRRGETPPAEVLRARFDERVELIELASQDRGAASTLALARALRRIAPTEYDAVHLHSSFAGLVGRLALRRGHHVSYSPHAFAFLRGDSTAVRRWAIRMAERALAKRGQLLVTSATEQSLAETLLRPRRVRVLESGIARSAIPAAPGPRLSTGERPVVLTMARLAHQKAPWRFAAVARELGDVADFVWVGGSEQEAAATGWMDDAPISYVPWVTPAEMESYFARADVFLFPSLFEGLSLSLIDAQARALPTVTSDVVGNRDTVVDQVTGFVCGTDAELVDAVRRLVTDPELRAKMGTAAREHAVRDLTDDDIGTDSLRLYAEDAAVDARHLTT